MRDISGLIDLLATSHQALTLAFIVAPFAISHLK
jgi:hypothetical protein